MKPATTTTASEPWAAGIWATSVTCRPDQSIAVPSPSPNAIAINPSRYAQRGSGVFTPEESVWLTTAVSGVLRKAIAVAASPATVATITALSTAMPGTDNAAM